MANTASEQIEYGQVEIIVTYPSVTRTYVFPKVKDFEFDVENIYYPSELWYNEQYFTRITHTDVGLNFKALQVDGKMGTITETKPTPTRRYPPKKRGNAHDQI